MRQHHLGVALAAVLAVSPALAVDAFADPSVQVGPRPFYLVEKMSPSPLKSALQQCADDPFYKTTFSIGHRGGGTLQFPEHTKESHEAGARMGAGILECDVTFTRDGQLVCRHDQCDLHTTTNILVTPLAAKCTQGPSARRVRCRRGTLITPASALCCTSDLTLAEFKTPQGQDGRLRPRPPRRRRSSRAARRTTAPISTSTGGTLLTPQGEHRAPAQSLGAKYTPELKAAQPQRQAAGRGRSSAARRATPRR